MYPTFIVGAPFKRLREIVLVLTPQVQGCSDRELLWAAQVGCRFAHSNGKVPLSPVLFCGAYLGEGERKPELAWLGERIGEGERRKRTMAQWCFHRSGAIWLLFPRAVDSDSNDVPQDLDQYSWKALDENQRTMDRRPVDLVCWRATQPYLERLSKDEVEQILRANIMSSLGSMSDLA